MIKYVSLLCSYGDLMARAKKVMHQEVIRFSESIISIKPDLKKERQEFQSQRCRTAVSEEFQLDHPTFSINIQIVILRLKLSLDGGLTSTDSKW